MTDIYIWVKNILLIIIALSFFQLLIPESTMEKYLKFIFSLVILATILEPLGIILAKI
jgi:stage III sporulation protein AF